MSVRQITFAECYCRMLLLRDGYSRRDIQSVATIWQFISSVLGYLPFSSSKDQIRELDQVVCNEIPIMFCSKVSRLIGAVLERA